MSSSIMFIIRASKESKNRILVKWKSDSNWGERDDWILERRKRRISHTHSVASSTKPTKRHTHKTKRKRKTVQRKKVRNLAEIVQWVKWGGATHDAVREKIAKTELAKPRTIATFTFPLFGIWRPENLLAFIMPLAISISLFFFFFCVLLLLLCSASRASTTFGFYTESVLQKCPAFGL